MVEDNEVNQLVAEQMLLTLGYEVDLVGNGQDAIDTLRQRSYRLVLMDGHMPVLDGLAATERIRAMEQAGELPGRTPIVALTANAVHGIRQQCLDAGMDDYLCKPITIDALSEKLAAYAPQPAAAAAAEGLLQPVPTQPVPTQPVPQAAPMQPIATPSPEQSPMPASPASPASPAMPATPAMAATPEITPASDGPLFDADELGRQSLGDRDFARRLLEIMRRSLDQTLAELTQSHDAGDADALERTAHRLRGAAADCGLMAIAAAAAQAERAAGAGDRDTVAAAVARLGVLVPQTQRKLDDVLAEWAAAVPA